jgi:hypothetical protein
MQRVMRMKFCPGTTMFEHYNVRQIVTCPFKSCSHYINAE